MVSRSSGRGTLIFGDTEYNIYIYYIMTLYCYLYYTAFSLFMSRENTIRGYVKNALKNTLLSCSNCPCGKRKVPIVTPITWRNSQSFHFFFELGQGGPVYNLKESVWELLHTQASVCVRESARDAYRSWSTSAPPHDAATEALNWPHATALCSYSGEVCTDVNG